MKKLLSILAMLFCITIIAPSCASDEGFEDIVINSELDQTAEGTGNSGSGNGGGETPPGGG